MGTFQAFRGSPEVIQGWPRVPPENFQGLARCPSGGPPGDTQGISVDLEGVKGSPGMPNGYWYNQ